MPKHSEEKNSHKSDGGEDLDLEQNDGKYHTRHQMFKHTFFARPRPLHILMLLIFVVFGTALVTQVRAQQSDPLERLSEDELVELLAELDVRESTLQNQQAELEGQVEELNSEANQLAGAREAAEKQSVQAQIAAGTIAVTGPGIIVGVADSSHQLQVSSFVTTLAELRNAGAEAIEINNVRLNLRSWFGEENGNITVDGTKLSPPYTWRAIGDSDTLSSALEIRGGAASQMRALGATVTIQRADSISIESISPSFTPEWAEVDSK